MSQKIFYLKFCVYIQNESHYFTRQTNLKKFYGQRMNAHFLQACGKQTRKTITQPEMSVRTKYIFGRYKQLE